MSPKVISAILTLLINIAVGVAVFFFMLLAMNGYSESDANYGIIAYIVLALLASLSMAVSAAFLAHILIKRKFRGVVSVLIATVTFTVIGAVLKVVCSVAGIAVAEVVRVNF